jgi:hypothetical protein
MGTHCPPISRKAMQKHGCPEIIVTDKLRSYGGPCGDRFESV